jgi:hypothetical protein
MNGRLVEVSEYFDSWKDGIGTYPRYELQPTGKGVFIQYGVDYEEFENGPGNYSTAIVEMKDGTVKNVPVHQIRFLEQMP